MARRNDSCPGKLVTSSPSVSDWPCSLNSAALLSAASRLLSPSCHITDPLLPSEICPSAAANSLVQPNVCVVASTSNLSPSQFASPSQRHLLQRQNALPNDKADVQNVSFVINSDLSKEAELSVSHGGIDVKAENTAVNVNSNIQENDRASIAYAETNYNKPKTIRTGHQPLSTFASPVPLQHFLNSTEEKYLSLKNGEVNVDTETKFECLTTSVVPRNSLEKSVDKLIEPTQNICLNVKQDVLSTPPVVGSNIQEIDRVSTANADVKLVPTIKLNEPFVTNRPNLKYDQSVQNLSDQRNMSESTFLENDAQTSSRSQLPLKRQGRLENLSVLDIQGKPLEQLAGISLSVATTSTIKEPGASFMMARKSTCNFRNDAKVVMNKISENKGLFGRSLSAPGILYPRPKRKRPPLIRPIVLPGQHLSNSARTQAVKRFAFKTETEDSFSLPFIERTASGRGAARADALIDKDELTAEKRLPSRQSSFKSRLVRTLSASKRFLRIGDEKERKKAEKLKGKRSLQDTAKSANNAKEDLSRKVSMPPMDLTGVNAASTGPQSSHRFLSPVAWLNISKKNMMFDLAKGDVEKISALLPLIIAHKRQRMHNYANPASTAQLLMVSPRSVSVVVRLRHRQPTA